MPRLVVVPGRSRVDLLARPALPGLRLVIDVVAGTVDLAAAAGGGPGTGRLAMRLRALVEEPGHAGGAPAWLAGGEPVAVDVDLTEVRCGAGDDGGNPGNGNDGAVRVHGRLLLPGTAVPLSGTGRSRAGAGGSAPAGGMDSENDGIDGIRDIEAVGTTLVDPRALGFGLPPLVTHAVHARWRLTLEPDQTIGAGAR